MITTKVIRIEQLRDYHKLFEAVPKSHIDMYFVTSLMNAFGTNCKNILVEAPYFESDYLSSYYIFYSKKLRRFDKHSYRLLFFSDLALEELVGYVSLRPTYLQAHMGRTYLEPQYLLKQPAHLIISDSKIHFLAGEAIIRAFPHMSQEGDVAVCAHCAQWSILRHFANRFHQYPKVSLGDLVEKILPTSGRTVPSAGLTPQQLTDVFHQFGIPCVVRHKGKLSAEDFLGEVVSYIESGIPILGIISRAEHAISILGRGDIDVEHIDFGAYKFATFGINEETLVAPRVMFVSAVVPSLIVNDDNFFPYQSIPRVPQSSSLPRSPFHPDYTMHDIDYIIVPLYPRIQLLYNDVKTYFLGLCTEEHIYSVYDDIVVRIFLASANTFREYVKQEQAAFGSLCSDVLMHILMPKFIWCVEISSPQAFCEERVTHLVILDSTASTVDPDPFLFRTGNGEMWYRGAVSNIEAKMGLNELSVPRFQSTLEKVKQYGED